MSDERTVEAIQADLQAMGERIEAAEDDDAVELDEFQRMLAQQGLLEEELDRVRGGEEQTPGETQGNAEPGPGAKARERNARTLREWYEKSHPGFQSQPEEDTAEARLAAAQGELAQLEAAGIPQVAETAFVHPDVKARIAAWKLAHAKVARYKRVIELRKAGEALRARAEAPQEPYRPPPPIIPDSATVAAGQARLKEAMRRSWRTPNSRNLE